MSLPDSDLQHDEQPIAALASGRSPGAVAVIRVSGPGCQKQVLPLLQRSRPPKPRQMTLTRLVDPAREGEVVDEPLVAFFPGPHSFTGQDTFELFLHGGSYLIDRTLRLLYAQGCRPAEPGEFTRRAYLAGKLDFSTAEGIGDLVAAQSEQQWLSARQLASGVLRAEIDGLRQRLIQVLAIVTAAVDFPEEHDVTSRDNAAAIRRGVEAVQDATRRLLATFGSGQIAREGLRVAILGPPNAGKSTLLNTLLGEARAIVSPEAGTTRDYIEASCLLDGRLLRLLDTAGIRDGAGAIEREGIARAREQAAAADLVLFLVPAADVGEAPTLLGRWQQELRFRRTIAVLSRADEAPPQSPRPANWFPLSCKAGASEGLPELRQALKGVCDEAIQRVRRECVITSPRHRDALTRAAEATGRIAGGLLEEGREEVLAFELQGALRALAQVIGDVPQDEVLDQVFRHFCVGK